MSTKSKSAAKPLPLSNTLRDLAVLRSSSKDILELFKLSPESDPGAGTRIDTHTNSAIDATVDSSYDFIRVSRAAIKLHDSGKVDMSGAKTEEVRSKYEDLLIGVQ